MPLVDSSFPFTLQDVNDTHKAESDASRSGELASASNAPTHGPSAPESKPGSVSSPPGVKTAPAAVDHPATGGGLIQSRYADDVLRSAMPAMPRWVVGRHHGAKPKSMTNS